MAKYTITHSCGHEETVQLYGPTKDREQKIAWMESRECPQCWGAKKRAQEDKEPILMTICTNGLDKDEDGDILAEVVLSGGTRPRKEEIKKLGYSWGEIRGGALNFLSTKRPDMAWSRNVKLLDLTKENENQAIVARIKADAEQLNAEIKFDISPFDVEMARQSLAKQEEEKAAQEARRKAVAAIPKPKRPACHPREQHPGEYWNGKFYGNAKRGREYYVENVKYSLTEEEYQECMRYRDELQDYNSKIKAM